MDREGEILTTLCDGCEEVKLCTKMGPTYSNAGESHFEWVLSLCNECLNPMPVLDPMPPLPMINDEIPF